MNFLIDNWMLISVAFVSGALLVWPAVTGGARAGTLTTTEAVMLMNREKAMVIDIGDDKAFAEGHIVGARHLPLERLEAELPGLAKNKATPLIMVCPSGVRSNRAVAIAKKLGYDNAHSLSGGMAAWRTASLPVEKA